MALDIFRKTCLVLLGTGLGFLLTACGGSGGSGGEGTLTTSLTDASTDEYKALYITVARVEVHPDSDSEGENQWETVAEPGGTYNLLDLVNGVRQELGEAVLDAGHYTQMRLIIGEEPDSSLNLFDQPHPFANYVVDRDDDELHELVVPSGIQTGLKIVSGFDINANQTTELILDFDAMRSVVEPGINDQFLLKPTVKVLRSTEAAIVEGTVTDSQTEPTPLEAFVTAQTTDSSASDPEDLVVIEAGTSADANGEYSLFLEPDDYNLVAVHPDYLPACTAVGLAAGDRQTVDLSLTADETLPGTVTGDVNLPADAPADQHVTIDFLQEISCENAVDPATVTVKFLNIAAGGTYEVQLPEGTYDIVASSSGMATQTFEVTVGSDTVTTQNITLETTP